MQIFQEIEKLYPKYLDFLEDICNIESPTNHKAGVDKVAEYCLAYAEGEGYKTELFAHEISGNAALITMNPDAKGKPIVLSAHMDTVHPVGSFGYPAVRREGDNMYGPGVTDCKGGIATAFLVMKALKEIGFTDRPIKLFLQSDEENSSATSGKKTVEQMCECAKDAEGFINLEGCQKGKAVLTRKGIIRYEFTVHGKAIHSARCAYGANAVAEAAHKIIELEKMKDPDGLTCNCIIKSGGDAPNTVPELCVFMADIRFATREELDLVKREIAEICEKNYIEGCTTKVREVSFRPSMSKSEKNDKFLAKMNEIFKKCSLPTLEPIFANGGSDAAYVTEAGIPCVDSLGPHGDFIHSTKEMVRMNSIAEAAERIASVILYI